MMPRKPEQAARKPLIMMADGAATIRIYRMRNPLWKWWWSVSLQDGRYAYSFARTRRDAAYRAMRAIRQSNNIIISTEDE